MRRSCIAVPRRRARLRRRSDDAQKQQHLPVVLEHDSRLYAVLALEEHNREGDGGKGEPEHGEVEGIDVSLVEAEQRSGNRVERAPDDCAYHSEADALEFISS